MSFLLVLLASAAPALAAPPVSNAISCESVVLEGVVLEGVVFEGAVLEEVAGRWDLGYLQSGVVEERYIPLDVELSEGGAVAAKAHLPGGDRELVGSFDAGDLALGGEQTKVALQLADGELRGTVTLDGRELSVVGRRPLEDVEPPRAPVVFPDARPGEVSREGLSETTAKAATALIEARMDESSAVGLSAAFVIDGKVVDVRHFGWEDFHADIPASDVTMYRWASISKPLTAVVAMQLVEEERLDLEADTRELLPEYDMGQPISGRQLLCHQAGVTHYRDMQVRTRKRYDVPHPFADSVLALDMFVETDLISEPGAKFIYSTPGYVVMGALVQRAGEGTFVEQVRTGVLEPLGMKSMQPDHPWVAIEHRTRGYRRLGKRALDTGTDDVSWKLAAGGWISTVEDLARFGAGLTDSRLLSSDSKHAMWTHQPTSDGKLTHYGLGFDVFEVEGQRAVAHSGGQLKTSTYLICCPERRVAVALMCNTQGTKLTDLGKQLLGLLLE